MSLCQQPSPAFYESQSQSLVWRKAVPTDSGDQGLGFPTGYRYRVDPANPTTGRLLDSIRQTFDQQVKGVTILSKEGDLGFPNPAHSLINGHKKQSIRRKLRDLSKVI